MSKLNTLCVILALVLLSLPACAVNGLVGYWPMDEGTGAIVDECSGAGMGGEGHVLGQVAWESTQRGPAITFDGKTTAVKVPGNPDWDGGEGELTLGLWVKLKLGTTGIILDHRFGGTPGAWGLLMEGGPMFALYSDAVKPVKLRFSDFRYDDWQYLTVVWKKAKDGWVKSYLNGHCVSAVDHVDCSAKYLADLCVGGRPTKGGKVDQLLTGNIRDLTLFNRTLSDDEVAALYQNGIPLGSPVVISSLHTDKVLYSPRETGTATVRVKNLSADAQQVDLALALVSGVQHQRAISRQPLTIPAHTTQSISVPLRSAGEEYGCEVRAIVERQGKPLAEKRDFFSVSDNFLKVGIGSNWGPIFTANAGSLTIPEQARKLYSNYYELFFWSPCDWALHVSPQTLWWSGQASYPENEDHLIDLLQKSHAQGIKVAMYASRNPAGPYGWEVARQHPEWFGGGGFGAASQFNVEALDNWNNPAWRLTQANLQKGKAQKTGWFVIPVDLRRQDALDYGIDRIIDSAKKYSWDAVRFDGHYTIVSNDEMSTRNMRELKERVWRQLPDFKFTFNMGRAPEWYSGGTHELREAMAGGGEYMQEGIRNWRYTNDQYTSWKFYATNELRIAKLIQGMGGTYHCMWSDQRLSPAQAYYKLVYGLIAGGHPADSDIYANTPGCPIWGAFMTRWSSALWHGNLRIADGEKSHFTVDKPAVQWTDIVQERVDSPTHKTVVLHLVNPPTTDEIAKTAFPNPLGTVNVSYTPPAGERVVGVRLVRPDLLPFDVEMKPQVTNNSYHVTVPGIRNWTMLLWELDGHFPVPATPPTFTEQPDPAKLQWSPDAPLITRLDPNKAETSGGDNPDDVIVPLTVGGVNIGKVTTEDPQSPQGTVEWRNKEKPSGRMGRYYTGPYAPGKYRLIMRLKWTDANAVPTPQSLSVKVYTDVKIDKGTMLTTKPVVFVTPGYPDAPEGAITFGERGSYRDYELGVVEMKKTDYISFEGIATTQTVGDNSIYAEKIIARSLGRYTDAQLTAWNTGEKPNGLRAPNGATPAKGLLVKGLFSNLYGVEQSIPCDTTYDLPEKYEELYAYDVVILANVDMRFSTFATRKLLKDFVEDGGRLVLLGGNRSLGEGGMKNTFIEAISPFTFPGTGEIQRCDPPLLLGNTAGTPAPDRPALFWRHVLPLAPGASVLAYAGPNPIAAAKPAGKGRVIVFAGTPLGEETKPLKPFWSCASWPTLLTRMVKGE